MTAENNVVTYHNRYGDAITFEHVGNEVFMRGGKWLRYGYDDDKTITMVDPSGGPYIELGNNLKEFWPKAKYKDLVIESINFADAECADCESVVVFKIK